MDKDILIFLGTIPWVLFLFVTLYYNKGVANSVKLKRLYLFVFIFAAIRYGIGYDYFGYQNVIEGHVQDYELERFEFLPRMLAIFAGQTHYQFFFIACSFLSIYPVYVVSKKMSVNPVESFTLFLLFPILFLDGLGIVRNAVAYSLILLMLYQIHIGNYVKSLICLAVAYGFHLSAVVGVLVFPLYFFLHNRNINVAVYLLSFAVSIVLLPFLEQHFAEFGLVSKFFANIEKELQGGGLFYYVFNAIAIFNLANWNKIASYNKENGIYLTLANAGVCLWNAFLAIDVTTAQRLSTFFLFPLILMIPTFRYIFKRSTYRVIKLFFYMLFICSLGLNLHAHYGLHRNMSNIPYQVFFLNPSDLFYHAN